MIFQFISKMIKCQQNGIIIRDTPGCMNWKKKNRSNQNKTESDWIRLLNMETMS